MLLVFKHEEKIWAAAARHHAALVITESTWVRHPQTNKREPTHTVFVHCDTLEASRGLEHPPPPRGHDPGLESSFSSLSETLVMDYCTLHTIPPIKHTPPTPRVRPCVPSPAGDSGGSDGAHEWHAWTHTQGTVCVFIIFSNTDSTSSHIFIFFTTNTTSVCVSVTQPAAALHDTHTQGTRSGGHKVLNEFSNYVVWSHIQDLRANYTHSINKCHMTAGQTDG